MNFLNINDNDLDNNSSDYSDEEFENIDYETIDFDKPYKNNNNIYIANLEEKIILELDNLDIFEVIEDEGKKFVIFNLDLDNEDQEELIEILYNLDEIALEKCLEYSQEWFNKKMSESDIENLYIPLYIDNYKKKNHILMKVELSESIDINQLKLSNINVIEIKGLIFYKKTFLYHIILKDILKEDNNLLSNIEKTKEINNKDTIKLEVNKKNPDDTIELGSNKVDKNINIELGDNKEEKNSNNTQTLKHAELLEKKRLEVQQNFINSEKMNKQAEELRIKAIESANELKNIELKLN